MRPLGITAVVALIVGIAISAQAYNAYDFNSPNFCMLGVPGNWSVTTTGHLQATTTATAECALPLIGGRRPDKLDFGYVDIYRGQTTYAPGGRVCATHYGAASFYCTGWVSASAGTGYKSLTFDSGTSGWSSFHSCDWHYNIYFDTMLFNNDQLINYRAYWTL